MAQQFKEPDTLTEEFLAQIWTLTTVCNSSYRVSTAHTWRLMNVCVSSYRVSTAHTWRLRTACDTSYKISNTSLTFSGTRHMCGIYTYMQENANTH